MGLKAVQLSTGFNACWVCIVSPNTSFCSTLVFHNPQFSFCFFFFFFFAVVVLCVCVCTVYLLLFRVLCFVVDCLFVVECFLLLFFVLFFVCVCVCVFFPFVFISTEGEELCGGEGDKLGGWGVEEVYRIIFVNFIGNVYMCVRVCVCVGGGVLYLSVLSVLTLLAVHIPLS